MLFIYADVNIYQTEVTSSSQSSIKILSLILGIISFLIMFLIVMVIGNFGFSLKFITRMHRTNRIIFCVMYLISSLSFFLSFVFSNNFFFLMLAMLLMFFPILCYYPMTFNAQQTNKYVSAIFPLMILLFLVYFFILLGVKLIISSGNNLSLTYNLNNSTNASDFINNYKSTKQKDLDTTTQDFQNNYNSVSDKYNLYNTYETINDMNTEMVKINTELWSGNSIANKIQSKILNLTTLNQSLITNILDIPDSLLKAQSIDEMKALNLSTSAFPFWLKSLNQKNNYYNFILQNISLGLSILSSFNFYNQYNFTLANQYISMWFNFLKRSLNVLPATTRNNGVFLDGNIFFSLNKNSSYCALNLYQNMTSSDFKSNFNITMVIPESSNYVKYSITYSSIYSSIPSFSGFFYEFPNNLSIAYIKINNINYIVTFFDGILSSVYNLDANWIVLSGSSDFFNINDISSDILPTFAHYNIENNEIKIYKQNIDTLRILKNTLGSINIIFSYEPNQKIGLNLFSTFNLHSANTQSSFFLRNGIKNSSNINLNTIKVTYDFSTWTIKFDNNNNIIFSINFLNNTLTLNMNGVIIPLAL